MQGILINVSKNMYIVPKINIKIYFINLLKNLFLYQLLLLFFSTSYYKVKSISA